LCCLSACSRPSYSFTRVYYNNVMRARVFLWFSWHFVRFSPASKTNEHNGMDRLSWRSKRSASDSATPFRAISFLSQLYISGSIYYIVMFPFFPPFFKNFNRFFPPGPYFLYHWFVNDNIWYWLYNFLKKIFFHGSLRVLIIEIWWIFFPSKYAEIRQIFEMLYQKCLS